MTEDEEFEFRHRLEQEQAKPESQPSMMEGALKGLKMGLTATMPAQAGGLVASEMFNRGVDTLASGAAEGAARLGVPPEIAGGIGVATNMGLNAIPAFSGMLGVGPQFTPKPLQDTAKTLLQSAVKPGMQARNSGQWDKAAKTMLEKQIPATQAGIEATQIKVSGLEDKIQGILESSPAKIDPYKAADNIKTAVKDVSFNLDQAKNLRDIEKVYDKFVSHPAIKDMGDISVATANKLKQAFYRELQDKSYVPGANLTAAAKSEKALAAGLREQVGSAEPAIVPSLKEQSELINVLKVAGPQVAREGNKNPVGLGWLSPSMQRTALWMLDRYPWFKSFAAQTLYNNATAIPRGLVGGAIATGEGVAEYMKNK